METLQTFACCLYDSIGDIETGESRCDFCKRVESALKKAGISRILTKFSKKETYILFTGETEDYFIGFDDNYPYLIERFIKKDAGAYDENGNIKPASQFLQKSIPQENVDFKKWEDFVKTIVDNIWTNEELYNIVFCLHQKSTTPA